MLHDASLLVICFLDEEAIVLDLRLFFSAALTLAEGVWAVVKQEPYQPASCQGWQSFDQVYFSSQQTHRLEIRFS